MKKLLVGLCAIFICTFAIAHTVNWHVGDQIISTTTCDSGNNITPPTAPAKRGYHVRGWGSRFSPNIFDGQWKSGIYNTDTGKYGAVQTRVCNANMMKVSPDTYYTVSFPNYDIKTDTRWLFYDTNKNFISSITTGKTTIKTPATAEYLNFYIAADLSVATAPDMQIEQGTTATQYQPYGTVYIDGHLESIN